MQLEAAKTELATVAYDLKRAREQHSADEEALHRTRDELSAALAKAASASKAAEKPSASIENLQSSMKSAPAKTQHQ